MHLPRFVFTAALLAVTGLVATVAPTGLEQTMAQAQAQTASPSARGATLFRQRCGSCHVATPNARSSMGPNLAGVVGRRAGTIAGYNFSNGMKQSGLTWTPQTLDAFLTAPARTVRGTRMMTSVTNAADRQAIVAYLQTAR